MIFVGIGGNLPYGGHPPSQNMEKVADLLSSHPDLTVAGESQLYVTAPVGGIDQPDFLNGVIALEGRLSPLELMAHLLEIEVRFGRVRAERWGPRTLDLDLLDFDGKVGRWQDGDLSLELPHPRLQDRAFVLIPLAEIAPQWVHPVTGESISALVGALGDAKGVRPYQPDV